MGRSAVSTQRTSSLPAVTTLRQKPGPKPGPNVRELRSAHVAEHRPLARRVKSVRVQREHLDLEARAAVKAASRIATSSDVRKMRTVLGLLHECSVVPRQSTRVQFQPPRPSARAQSRVLDLRTVRWIPSELNASDAPLREHDIVEMKLLTYLQVGRTCFRPTSQFCDGDVAENEPSDRDLRAAVPHRDALTNKAARSLIEKGTGASSLEQRTVAAPFRQGHVEAGRLSSCEPPSRAKRRRDRQRALKLHRGRTPFWLIADDAALYAASSRSGTFVRYFFDAREHPRKRR